VENQIASKTIADEIISDLDECDQFDIYHLAKAEKVFIDIM